MQVRERNDKKLALCCSVDEPIGETDSSDIAEWMEIADARLPGISRCAGLSPTLHLETHLRDGCAADCSSGPRLSIRAAQATESASSNLLAQLAKDLLRITLARLVGG